MALGLGLAHGRRGLCDGRERTSGARRGLVEAWRRRWRRSWQTATAAMCAELECGVLVARLSRSSGRRRLWLKEQEKRGKQGQRGRRKKEKKKEKKKKKIKWFFFFN